MPVPDQDGSVHFLSVDRQLIVQGAQAVVVFPENVTVEDVVAASRRLPRKLAAVAGAIGQHILARKEDAAVGVLVVIVFDHDDDLVVWTVRLSSGEALGRDDRRHDDAARHQKRRDEDDHDGDAGGSVVLEVVDRRVAGPSLVRPQHRRHCDGVRLKADCSRVKIRVFRLLSATSLSFRT